MSSGFSSHNQQNRYRSHESQERQISKSLHASRTRIGQITKESQKKIPTNVYDSSHGRGRSIYQNRNTRVSNLRKQFESMEFNDSDSESESQRRSSHHNSNTMIHLPKLDERDRSPLMQRSPAISSPQVPSSSVSHSQQSHNRNAHGRLRRHSPLPIASASAVVLSPMSALTSIGNTEQGPSPSYISSHPVVQEECGSAAVSSMKGVKPGRPHWINQDNFFLLHTTVGDLYCVLDGHGEHGHYVSRRCRNLLPQFVQSTLDLSKAFAQMQEDLLDATEFDASCSGATCVLMMIQGMSISMAHCGDSRAVMGRRAASVTGGNINYVAVVLTDDHKPDRPDEKARIQSCGGQVGSRQTLLDLTGRSNSTVAAGPCRVWYRKGTDTLGLAMSRSLGDGIVHTCGVSAEPEISEFRLDPQGRDEFVILATDGVWDVIDSAQAVRIVGGLITKAGINEWSALEASQHLCLLARRRWEALSLMIDDITCAVVKLPLLHERPAQ